MDLIETFGVALWELTAAMAPYILFGLFFAGILHELVPGDFVQRHLGRDNVASVMKATLFGIPLPVCSCGVIPLAAAIQKEGASRGAVLSFLISTPITGIDSILATFGMFGWVFTLYRVVTSILIAFAAGVLSNLLIQDTPKKQSSFGYADAESATPAGPSADKPRSNPANDRFNASSAAKPTFTMAGPVPLKAGPSVKPALFAQTPEIETEGCGCDGSCHEEPAKKRFDFGAAMRFGFVTLLGDIAKPLFWGLVIGAAITVAIPENVGEWLATYDWLGYLLVIIIAVPMYVCATASLPIAASLVLSGVSLGAAFVFLSAGPATNTVTMGVVKKMLGTRALTIYLATISVGSIFFGLLIDLLFGSMQIDPRSVVHIEEEVGLVAALSSIALWILILKNITPAWMRKKSTCKGGSCCGN